MADYSQTVTGSVNCFGGGGSSLWNAYNWNAFKWGEGTVKFGFDVVHMFDSGGVSPTSAHPGFQVVHSLDSQSTTVESAPIKEPQLVMGTNSVSCSSDMTEEVVGDGSGYSYVFRSNTTDAEDRFAPTWMENTDDTESWTTSTDPSTTWS